MRRALSCLLLLAGCTVQVGRDPNNRFQVHTGDPVGAPPAKTDPEDPQGLDRNWRLGAENDPIPEGKSPRDTYDALFGLFKSDHHEAMRQRSGFPKHAQSYLNRAARRLREMKTFLPAGQQDAFAPMVERYQHLVDDALAYQPAVFAVKAQSFENDFVKRFAADKIAFGTPAKN